MACNHIPSERRKTTDLFLGVYLGMEKQEFYDHCWKLNRDGIVIQGPGNQSVEYKMTTDDSTGILVHFYPNFHNNRIYELPVLYSYEPWAPWNRQYWSDALLTRIVQHFDSTYGKLDVLNHQTMGKVYFRIDGRRRINVFIKDDQYVQAVFTDLRVERELKRNQNK
ncbi:MAG: hypothetical protein KatS3mg032_0276 [Cyclobacteriaceae bacterium]|nr:MAG: hypothetical protein KatS3mg032_0276 [Cyclobacteriaceae bacterium]